MKITVPADLTHNEKEVENFLSNILGLNLTKAINVG